MNKRTFFKLIGAMLASPLVMRMLAWAGQEKLRNWAGNIEYSTDRLQTSTSLEQVQDYVKAQNKLKVLGTRHCFNNIADSKDQFLSLKPMDDVIAIDPAKRTVTVAAGSTYGSCVRISTPKGSLSTTSHRYRTSRWRALAPRQLMAPARRMATWRPRQRHWK